MFCYPVDIEHDTATGQFIVSFVDVPATYSTGETRAEALLNAKDALETAFFYLMQERKPIPSASPLNDKEGVALPVIITAKVALYTAMLNNGTRKSDLARQLNLAPTLVDRLLSLKHKSRIEQLETALALFNQQLLIDVR
ncbi:Antitoxin HicB [Patescibacteria group bacterium]|nr:Antitoxin HicB [Patescibacteria group bacterium]